MTTAAAAAEYRSNVGHDCTLADAYDSEYLDTDEVGGADLMSTEQRGFECSDGRVVRHQLTAPAPVMARPFAV